MYLTTFIPRATLNIETLGVFLKTMFTKITNYFKNSRLELKKVVWPTKKQTINHTLLVIGFSLAMAIFLGLVDYGLNKVVDWAI